MVVIRELRILPDKKSLVIDASVDTLSFYDNVGIAEIKIDDKNTFTEAGYSSEAKTITLDDNTYSSSEVQYDGDKAKRVRFILDQNDLEMDVMNNIFFVYIVTEGTPSPEASYYCGADNKVTMGVAYNIRPFYNTGMRYIRELGNNCEVPRGFIDFILRFKAFQLAMKTGHYRVALDYWNTLLSIKNLTVPKPGGCGCHGTY